MNELESKFNARYSSYLSDFKTMSIDKNHPNKAPLCSDTHHKFYDFDKIIKIEFPSKHPASPDTLIFNKNTVYLIEFKNLSRTKANKYKEKIQNKLWQGQEALLKIFNNLSIKYKDFTFVFCVIYKNSHTNSRNYYAEHISNRNIQFDLAQYKDRYFDDIITNNVDFFRKQFIEKIDPNLPC